MKGSPAKMGTIRGTVAHKSMLRQSELEGYWKFEDKDRIYHTDPQGETEFFKTPEEYFAHRKEKGFSEDFEKDLTTYKRSEKKALSKPAQAERRAKYNPEGKSPHEIKLEKELRQMKTFGRASKFEIDAMQRKIDRVKTERLSVKDEAGETKVASEQPVVTESQQEEEQKEVITGSGRPTGYYDKTSDNYMKGVENYDLANMKFFSPERIAYYSARGWALDKTTDPNFTSKVIDKKTKKKEQLGPTIEKAERVRREQETDPSEVSYYPQKEQLERLVQVTNKNAEISKMELSDFIGQTV